MKNCPFCHNSPFRKNKLGYYQCDGCGLVIDEKMRLDTLQLDKIKDAYFEDSFTVEKDKWAQFFDGLNTSRVLKTISSFQNGGKKLLEIGIGHGDFLNGAKKQGFDVTGCETSKTIASYVQKKYGVEVFNGYVEDFPKEREFDVIVLRHVLEHMPDPINSMKKIVSLLKDKGVLYIAVPNIGSFNASFKGWVAYEPYHLFYYSDKALASLTGLFGLNIRKKETYEPFSGFFLTFLKTLRSAPTQT
ncbi:MAG: class I SAM-dependent methyltransferase [Nitrospinae bacterium]|nr:class I SAM-dependent methyltransferase [Nitrospinota bacterium]